MKTEDFATYLPRIDAALAALSDNGHKAIFLNGELDRIEAHQLGAIPPHQDPELIMACHRGLCDRLEALKVEIRSAIFAAETAPLESLKAMEEFAA